MPRMSSRPMAGAALISAAALTAAEAQSSPPVLEPKTSAFVEGLPKGPAIYTLSPSAARDVLSGVQKSVRVPLSDVSILDRELPVGPAGRTSIRIYRPKAAEGALPVVIYTHGGGWVLGGKDTHDRLVRELAAGAGAVVVFVDYERSPEARFPTAIEQSYAVMTYVAANAVEFGADPARLAIAGDSVGGNMTAVIALLAKERKGPKIAAQLLLYPVTDATMSTSSYVQFAEGPWLTKKAMAWYWDQYLPDVAKRADVHASPVNASTDQLRGLPQALLIVDENDVLRDEGEAYGRKLAAAGVPVVSTRYNGTIHDFMMLNPIAETPPVRAAVNQTIGYLRAVFAR